MIWYAWALVVVLVVYTLATIARVGKPREPITPDEAMGVAIVNGLLLWAVLALAGAA